MAEITDVRVYKIEGQGTLRAYATVTLDNSYVVHGLRVMEGETGLWVGMPASKNKRGEFKDVFHPITREARDILVRTVVEKYEKSAGEAAAPSKEEKSEEVSEEKSEERLEDKPEE